MDHNNSISNTSSTAAAMSMMRGFAASRLIFVAVHLRIPDILAKRPRSSAELARITDAHPHSMHRMLRALCALGICREPRRDLFELRKLGECLRRDASSSLRSTALLICGHSYELWENLLHSVLTGETVRKLLYGTSDFEFLSRDPEMATIFHQAMVEQTRPIAAAVAAAYDCSQIGEIIDVGGGYGELLVALLRANPNLRGVVFDMPHAQAGAVEFLRNASLADRAQFVPGDFFHAIPASADAYILKSVIHHLDDERAVAILTNCRRAMKPDAILLLVEPIMPDKIEVTTEHQMVTMLDLQMMVAAGGRERTEEEFKQLLHGAGLTFRRLVRSASPMGIIEARRTGAAG
jgi:SAM-dependent methyltransferase